MLRNRRFQYAVICGLALASLTGCPKKEKKEESQPRLRTTLLDTIREPEEDQFSTPEKCIEYLVEQVRVQNIDDGLRTFPVKEWYSNVDFRTYTAYLQMVDYHESPLPDSGTRNLVKQIDLATSTFNRLSVYCLGIDPTKSEYLEAGLKGEALEEKLNAWEQRLDFGALSDLKVKEIVVRGQVAVREKDAFRSAVGASEMATAKVTLETQGMLREFECGLIKIGSNWRFEGGLYLPGTQEESNR